VTRPERVGLALVLLVYLGLASAYAWLTPPWNNPDEPAHYNYIAFVAERLALPELVAGDWDQSLLSEAIPERFHPRFDVSSMRYESHQPPLYYLIGAPVYSATSSASLRARVLALRGISIMLGLALGIAAFKLARELAPSLTQAGPLAAAIALLIPMSTAAAASINNDMLSMVLAAIATLLVVRELKRSRQPDRDYGWRSAASLGLVVGLLLLTKLTVYVLAAIALAAVIAPAVMQNGAAKRSGYARHAVLMVLVVLLVSGWWFVRSAGVYGWDDLLAQRRHDAVVVGQPRYADYGPGNWLYLAVTAFHSFFAQLGWMTIVVDNLTYALYGAFVIMALVGIRMFRSALSRPALIILGAVTALVVGQLLYYNLSFIQAQGRYLFPALGAIAAVLAVGWIGLARSRLGAVLALVWISMSVATAAGGVGNWDIGLASATVCAAILLASMFAYRRMSSQGELYGWLTAATVLGLSALNLMCLTRYVVPFYRG
jgi:hypothetical protein